MSPLPSFAPAPASAVTEHASFETAHMHERLRQARVRAGYRSASEAIRQFGWKGSTYRAHENGQNQFDFETARIYAEAYNTDVGWLLGGKAYAGPVVAAAHTLAASEDAVYSGQTIEVIGKVGSGIWVENMLLAAGEMKRASAFPPDPKYPLEAQFDLVVEGSSLDRFAKDGDLIRCVDIRKARLEVEDGDLVVIRRVRDTTLTEISAKRIRKLGPRVEFLPESDDPRHRAPALVKDTDAGIGNDIEIVAKILWMYRRA